MSNANSYTAMLQRLLATFADGKTCRVWSAEEIAAVEYCVSSQPAIQALMGALDEIEVYLENRQDIRDGSDGPMANEEMSLLTDLRWWREAAGLSSPTATSSLSTTEKNDA